MISSKHLPQIKMEYWWFWLYVFNSRITLLSLHNNNKKKNFELMLSITSSMHKHINTQINWWIKMSKGQNCNFRNKKRGSNALINFSKFHPNMCKCSNAIQIKFEIFYHRIHHFHVLFNRIFSGFSAIRALSSIYLFLVPATPNSLSDSKLYGNV